MHANAYNAVSKCIPAWGGGGRGGQPLLYTAAASCPRSMLAALLKPQAPPFAGPRLLFWPAVLGGRRESRRTDPAVLGVPPLAAAAAAAAGGSGGRPTVPAATPGLLAAVVAGVPAGSAAPPGVAAEADATAGLPGGPAPSLPPSPSARRLRTVVGGLAAAAAGTPARRVSAAEARSALLSHWAYGFCCSHSGRSQLHEGPCCCAASAAGCTAPPSRGSALTAGAGVAASPSSALPSFGLGLPSAPSCAASPPPLACCWASAAAAASCCA